MIVLVLDGNQNQAVAAVRSLADAGHTVFAGESAPWSKAGWSRLSSGSFQYPPPHAGVDAFVQAIATFAREHPGALVLPMTEATTLPISSHRDTLSAAGGRFVLPGHADLLRAFSKEETTNLAASLGISVPKTLLVSSPEQAREAAQSVRYPVVMKPRASEEISTGGKIQTAGRPRYASNPEQFDAACRDLSARTSAFLVQEFIAGEGTGYFALMHHGELRAEFAHQRIRDVHPTGSGSAVRVSIAPDPEIRRESLSILKALRWHGVAMVEYRKPANGPAVFMEVNGRFWHSLPLACYAGVDFPALLAQMAEHGDIAPTSGYRTGVRCRWFLGDARHLVEVWKGSPLGYPGVYPSKVGTLFRVLTPVPGTYHDLFQWRDPLPEFGDWIYNFQRLAQKPSVN